LGAARSNSIACSSPDNCPQHGVMSSAVRGSGREHLSCNTLTA
jgi:hypothetical protein